jgi:hypothetical protein
VSEQPLMPPNLTDWEKWAWHNASDATRRRIAWAYAKGKEIEAATRRRSSERKRRHKGTEPPWDRAEAIRLVVQDERGFGCDNLPHLAVALAHLDVRVRVYDRTGFSEIAQGQISRPGIQGIGNRFGAPAKPGERVTFRMIGPDTESALPLIRETFARGLEAHLAVVRRYVRLAELDREPDDAA